MNKRWSEKIPYTVIGAVVMFVATAVLYWRYLVGEKIYIHPIINADSINQFYPMYVDAAKNFAEHGTVAFYSFASGFGDQRTFFSPFFILIFMFGKEYVPYMMGLKIALCVFLSGWIMGLFLRERGMECSACLFGSLGYAFSMQLVNAGSYLYQGELAVIGALVLYSLEKCFHKKKSGFVLLLFSAVLGYLSMSLYYELLYGGTAVAYVIIRLLYLEGGWKRIGEKRKSLLFLGLLAAIAGVVISVWQKMEAIFSSARFQTGLESWAEQWKNTFSIDNLQSILNFWYRTISPNILGVWNVEQEYGYPFRNGRDDSGYYVGLLMLLVIPLLVRLKKNKKITIISTLLIMLLAILVCLPGVRILVNGFSGTNYKLTRLLGSLILVGISTYLWNEFIGYNKKVEIVPIIIIDGILAAGFIFPMLLGRRYFYPGDVARVLVFLVLYTIVLLVWNKRSDSRYVCKGFLLILFAAELVSSNYRFVNPEEALAKSELERGYYNDGTVEVIEEIRVLEESSVFYRVNKAYESLLYSDAEVQNYYGTSYYRGGTDEKNMTAFIKSFAVPTKSNILGLFTGTYGYPALSAACGVRYGISDNAYMELGYQYVESVGDKNLYKNMQAMPMLYVYHNVISEDGLLEYDLKERHDILLQACVLENEEAILYESAHRDALDVNPSEPVREYHYTNYEIGTPLEIETVGADEILVVKLKNEDPASLYLYWSSSEGGWSDKDHRILSIYSENQETFAELANQDEIYGVILYCLEDVYELQEVALYVYDEEEYNEFLQNRINILRHDSGELYDVGNGGYAGEISVHEPGILYVSIPYDAPFDYYLNGELYDTVRANYIFTGIPVEEGDYRLEIKPVSSISQYTSKKNYQRFH